MALVRKFSEKEILPYAHQMDVEAHFVPGLIQKIADLGFMGINVPEEYGGVGADEVTKALVIMEFAKYDASVAELLAVHTLSSDIILKHGTPEQKEKYLTKACTGAVGAFALTNQMPVRMRPQQRQRPFLRGTSISLMVPSALSAIWGRMKGIM